MPIMDEHGAQASTGAYFYPPWATNPAIVATTPVRAHPPTIICVWWTWNPIFTTPDLHDGSTLRRRVPIGDLSFFVLLVAFDAAYSVKSDPLCLDKMAFLAFRVAPQRGGEETFVSQGKHIIHMEGSSRNLEHEQLRKP